jgi:hypothetical protein
MELLREVYDTFASDPLIDELGFVPVPDAFTDHPPVVLVDHKFGLALHRIPALYTEARAAFMTRDASLEVMAGTVLLLINADCYSAWNSRRKCCVSGRLDIAQELRFVDVILTKHKKSSCAWWHRQWVCTRLINGRKGECSKVVAGESTTTAAPAAAAADRVADDEEWMLELMARELFVCEKGADRYRRCYYAWQYRVWLSRQLVDSQLVPLSHAQRLLRSQVRGVRLWITGHVTDASAFCFLQHLITLELKVMMMAPTRTSRDTLTTSPDGSSCDTLGSESESVVSLLKAECVFAMVIISNYPGHCAAWLHIRFLAQQLWAVVLATATRRDSSTSLDQAVRLSHKQRCVARLTAALVAGRRNGATFDLEATVFDPNMHVDMLALVDCLTATHCANSTPSPSLKLDNGGIEDVTGAMTALEWLIAFVHATIADTSCAAAGQQRLHATETLRFIECSCLQLWRKPGSCTADAEGEGDDSHPGERASVSP